MIKKISKEFLIKNGACSEGIRWFLNNNETDNYIIITKLIKDKHLDWANWLITHLMNKKQCIRYTIFAAESVIKIYEKKCLKDSRPKKTIQAAKNYLKNPCKKTKDAASAAYASAYAAAYTVADYAAAYVSAVAISAYASAYAATYAAYTAANVTAIVKKESQIKILNYGIKILKEVL